MAASVAAVAQMALVSVAAPVGLGAEAVLVEGDVVVDLKLLVEYALI